MTDDSKRGKWMFARKRQAATRPRHAHLMCSETKTFCGRTIVHTLPTDACGEWRPEDHPGHACSQCLEWWESMKKPPREGTTGHGMA